MKKRILSLVLTLVLIFSLVPFEAMALSEPYAVGGCTFTTQPKDVTVSVGDTAVFTAAATNPDSTELEYLWFNADEVNIEDLDVSNVSGMIDKIKAAKLGEGKTLRIENVTAENDGMRIRCAVYYEKTLVVVTVPKDLTFSDVAVLSVSSTVCEEHTLSFVPAKAATCAEEGNIPYYKCTVCGHCYLDAAAEIPTSVANCTLAVINTHNDVAYVEETAGNCCEKGLKAHYACNICGKYFSDAEATEEISASSIETTLDADNHKNLVEYPAVAATCSEKGNIHYWYCDGCREYYSDADAKTPISRSDTELDKDPANHSNLAEYPAKAATCKEAGNIRYWYCAGCNNYYSDAEGTSEIKKSDTELKKLDHDYVWAAFNDDGVEYHAKKCSMCGTLTETGSHSGGTAYCHGRAVCETCGFEYGEFDPDTHVNTELRNFVAPTPESTGYSGDLYCIDCEKTVEYGHVTEKTCAHDLQKIEAKDPTCSEEGNIEYYRCTKCNVCYSDETALTEIAYEDTLIETVSHSYTKWIITDTDHQKVCEWCDKAQPLLYDSPKEHTMSTGDPTCHSGHYCLICNYDDGERDLSNHDGDTEVRGAYEPEGDKPGYTGDTYCTGCNNILESGRKYYTPCAGGCAGTLYYVAGTERTCYEDGVKAHFVCTVCGNMYFDAKATAATDDAGIIDECTGHDLHPGMDALSANSIVALIKSAGFTDMNYEDALKLLMGVISGEDVSFDDFTVQDFLNNVHIKDIDHCYDDEYHWLGCQRCGKTLEDIAGELEENGISVGGTWSELGKKEAHSGGTSTCKEKKICDECGEHYGVLGDHRYELTYQAPTCTEKGYRVYKCADCEMEHSKVVIPATGHSLVKGKCQHCGGYFSNPFYDVKSSDTYYKEIMWAYTYEPQITNGISETEFDPLSGCTRGQVVTFLWRLAGRPEPTSTVNPFYDVNNVGRCAPYYTAILWAYENKIVEGMGDGTFLPHDTVTREQFVTFLWRYMGRPAPTVTTNPFYDVTKAGNGIYYYDAILWAYEKGITIGDGPNHFSPGDICTRWHVVTFLYRAVGESKAYN